MAEPLISAFRQQRCSLCCTFTVFSCAGGNQFLHHESLYALKKSAADGCDLCGFFWHCLVTSATDNDMFLAMKPDNQKQISVRAELTSNGNFMKELDGRPAFDTLYLCTDESPIVAGVQWTAELFTSRESPLARYFNGREINLDPSSPANFADVKTWLELCSRHQKCERISDKPLPKRLIDVGPPGSETVRLEVTEGQIGTYVALSYCWGKSQSLVTTMETLDENLRGISLSNFPKTLADAVYITRKLGFRYIWIDALCIIQAGDSNDEAAFADWQDQASKMADVYGNAFVTIAAAGAADKTEGCFIPRSPIKHVYTIPLTEAANSSIIFVRPSIHNSPYHDNLLSDRAWTFQEALLSRRLLLYEKRQVTFMCIAGKQTESKRGIGVAGVASPRIFPALVTNDSEREKVLRDWYNLLNMDFCGRSITSDGDILPALSGVARKFQNSLGGKYYAGIWETDILKGLLWRCGNATNISSARGKKRAFLKPRAVYCAPSWSWASLHGTIWYRTHQTRNKRWAKANELNICPIEVLDIQTNLVGPSYDPMGQVSGGFIKINAPVRNVVLVSNHVNKFSHADWKALELRPNAPGVLGFDGLLVGEEVVDKSSIEAVGAMGFFDTEDMSKSIRNLTCLFIWPEEGLMLIPDTSNETDGDKVFKRIGFFTCIRKDWLDGAEPKCVVII